MEKRVLLIPQYMNKFQCIGPKCEDNCCYGWKVYIDKDTYKKYRNVSNLKLKPLLDKKVTRNRSNPSFKSYAKIKLDSKSFCPFLREDKLCNIQKELGAQFLSYVCTTYPRITNKVNEIYETSLTLSCPEAARLVLLNHNVMEFDEIEEPAESEYIIRNQIDTDSIENMNNVKKYFWQLRIFSISILQNRKYSLEDRLVILGLFMKKVQECLDNGKLHEIPLVIEKYNNIVENQDLEKYLKDIPANLTIQMELMKEFNDYRFSMAFPQNALSYINCVAEFLNGIKYTDDTKVEEIGDRYRQAYLDYYEPFEKTHQYIFENLLVNYVFRKLFPVSSKREVFDDYTKIVIHYAFIKMLLIGMAAYNKKLDESLIVRLVYSFSRAVEHNNVFFDNTFKLFKQNGYNTMAYMAILIRN